MAGVIVSPNFFSGSSPVLKRAYTLLEMLAAVAVLAVILALLFSTTGMATMAWRENGSTIHSFQQGRNAFNCLTSRLSRATLNNYRDYFDTQARQFNYPNNSRQNTEYRYRSELHFLCGQAKALIGDDGVLRPTHAIFFQAPLGKSNQSSSTPALRSLLNTCGYYIQFGEAAHPISFLTDSSTQPARHRFYEVVQERESLNIYNYPNKRTWLQYFVKSGLASSSHALADNVIALVFLPRRNPTDAALAPQYEYDSRAWQSPDSTLGALTQNQLPPLIQVTMVVIDETSARTLEAKGKLQGIVDPGLFQNAAQFETDLHSLQESLNGQARYRVYQTTLSFPSTILSASNGANP